MGQGRGKYFKLHHTNIYAIKRKKILFEAVAEMCYYIPNLTEITLVTLGTLLLN